MSSEGVLCCVNQTRVMRFDGIEFKQVFYDLAMQIVILANQYENTKLDGEKRKELHKAANLIAILSIKELERDNVPEPIRSIVLLSAGWIAFRAREYMQAYKIAENELSKESQSEKIGFELLADQCVWQDVNCRHRKDSRKVISEIYNPHTLDKVKQTGTYLCPSDEIKYRKTT